MELVLQRSQSVNGCTLGDLTVDGVHECFTCEDQIRESEANTVANIAQWKVYGRTAIPAGRYRIRITKSKRFDGRLLPELQGVPGFAGIRIHSGNKPVDTDGCLLPGVLKTHGFGVLRSVEAFDALFTKLQKAEQDGGEIWIDVRNPAPAVIS